MEKVRTYINLFDEELLLLDGKCSPEAQKAVDLAKARQAMSLSSPDLPDKVVKLIGDIVNEIRTNGRLIFQSKSISYCPVCEKDAGYARYPRSGRYHRKGDINRDRPLTMYGVEFADRFVTIKNRVSLGCCGVCWDKWKERIQSTIKDEKGDIPEALSGQPSKWKRYDNRECKCGWKGHEGQLGDLPAMMGGYYKGKCPSCGAENRLFGETAIKLASGFTLVEIIPKK